MNNSVQLVVYDISGGLARQFGSALIGMELDCLPHTGVIVFGQEYFFGGGIQRMPHLEVVRMFGISPLRKQELGATEKTAEDFHRYLDSISSRFQQTTYDVFRNNCNHFTDTAVRFLLNGTGIPAEIVNLPERVLATPMGQMLQPMWVNMQQRMQDQFVPFNSASPQALPFSNLTSMPTSAAVTTTPSTALPPAQLVPHPTSSSNARRTLVECIRGIQEKCTLKESMIALETLATIVKNIVTNPHEEKYRRLSLQNDKFRDRLGRHELGIPVLLSLGFDIDTTEKFVFMTPTPAKWDKLVMSEKIITAARKKCIKEFLKESKVATSADAYKLVDQKDTVVQEVVLNMFST